MSTYWVQSPAHLQDPRLLTRLTLVIYRRVVSCLKQENLTADKGRLFLEALINSCLLVFAGEMGDKTQLLSLMLVCRYGRPWTILSAVFVATVLNHALAAFAGSWLSSLVEPRTLSWILAATFFAFAVWILVPDKDEEMKTSTHLGVFLATLIAFFIAEMGDKTQLATIALGAKYSNLVAVTMGTTLGMMGSNALAIFFGRALHRRISMKWIRRIASFLFLLFGLAILIGY